MKFYKRFFCCFMAVLLAAATLASCKSDKDTDSQSSGISGGEAIKDAELDFSNMSLYQT